MSSPDAGQLWRNVVGTPPDGDQVTARQAENRLPCWNLLAVLNMNGAKSHCHWHQIVFGSYQPGAGFSRELLTSRKVRRRGRSTEICLLLRM